MSWLNFNPSLSNIKDQLSTFANTVLAEDKIEIQGAAGDSVEPDVRQDNKATSNDDDSWRWSTDESKTDQLKTDETITNLKKRIVELENENRDLITSLDQLDQNHQQNTEELVKMKCKLDEELEIVTEKYEILNMKYNKLALAENAYKKKINELKNKCEELSQQKIPDLNRSNEILSKCKQLEHEKSQLSGKMVSLETTNRELENLLHDTNNAIDSKLSDMAANIQQLEAENKALRIALQMNKETKNNNEDYKIRAEFETKIKDLEDQLTLLKTETPIVDNKNDNSIVQLETLDFKINKVERIEPEGVETKESQTEESYLESEISKKESNEAIDKNEDVVKKMYKKQIQDLKDQIAELHQEQIDNRNKYSDMKTKLEDYQSRYEELLENNIEVHKNYWRTLNDNFREYLTDEELHSDLIENDNSLIKFSSRMKNISKILGEFETKNITLETKLFELNQNKTDLQNDKNAEIERLLQNSEMLTQELLKKSKEINDLEEECSQLMKNNDLLINKLTQSKESGLQTIFESNEDNVAILEKQLETANQKIEDLEKSLSTNDSTDKMNNSMCSDQPNQVNDAQEFIELNEDVNKLDEENRSLKKGIEDIEQKLYKAENERDNCRAVIDKMKLDFETTEYQFTEMNINLETLSEEIEKHKIRIDALVSENENLKLLRNEDSISVGELGVAKEELSRANECNKNLQQKLEDFEQAFNARIENEKIEIEELQKALDDSLKERLLLEKRIEDTGNILSRVQADFKKCDSENNILRSFYDTLCNELNVEQGNKNILETAKVFEHICHLREQIETIQKENHRLNFEVSDYQSKITALDNTEAIRKELQDLMASRNELITMVQNKHQENLTYHAEIQRLSQILKQETEKSILLSNQINELERNTCPAEMLQTKNAEIEKLTDQVSFLKQKCDVLAQNMLEEQNKVESEKLMSTEKEATLSKKLERLQSHLMEVEEHYTQELLQSEQKIALLQARLNEVEQREKDSSTIYTSVSIRANQQNEALQQQLQSMTSQRDDLRKQLMELEDENNVNSAALSNLQLVLEQFQRDKEADVIRETDRIRRQIKQEQKIQEELRREISNLEAQIHESKQGLQAALRLTDQLEISKNQISILKEEVTVLTEKLNKKQEELKMVTSQTDGKVDKSLIKNLVIGFITSSKNLNKDQMQILKIIATVLDFNEQDHNKTNLNQSQQSNWLKSLLTPIAGDEIPPHESLSRAFVNFLENESKPRVIPSLLPTNSSSEASSRKSSRTTPTPIVLNEIVLPTFSDFPQHRNSSSILKGVLKDNP